MWSRLVQLFVIILPSSVFGFQMAGNQQIFRYLQHVASEKACAQCYYSYFQPFLDRPVDSRYCCGIFHKVSHPPVPSCAAPKAASKRKCLGKLPFPDGAIEALRRIKESGRTKCRNSKFGCQERRKKSWPCLECR